MPPFRYRFESLKPEPRARWRALDLRGCRRYRGACASDAPPATWHGGNGDALGTVAGLLAASGTRPWLTTGCSKALAVRADTDLLAHGYRPSQDREKRRDRFANLRWIGIHEISYHKGQRYLVV
jgi:hypothetical protein